MNRIIHNYTGFADLTDLFGVNFLMLLKPLTILAVSVGSVLGLMEVVTGMNANFLLIFIFGNMIDIVYGTYVNSSYLQQGFNTTKFFRGLFKVTILFTLIMLTNQLRQGFTGIPPEQDLLYATINYITASLHYFVMLMVGMYTLLGITENGAKHEIDIFVKLASLFKLKIKKVEDQFIDGK